MPSAALQTQCRKSECHWALSWLAGHLAWRVVQLGRTGGKNGLCLYNDFLNLTWQGWSCKSVDICIPIHLRPRYTVKGLQVLGCKVAGLEVGKRRQFDSRLLHVQMPGAWRAAKGGVGISEESHENHVHSHRLGPRRLGGSATFRSKHGDTKPERSWSCWMKTISSSLWLLSTVSYVGRQQKYISSLTIDSL